MALPAMRARARCGVSSSTWSHCVRIITTARVGRAEGSEQARDGRVHPDSPGAASYPRSAAHRIAPHCNGLPHRDGHLGDAGVQPSARASPGEDATSLVGR
jgi:hypothetical protein